MIKLYKLMALVMFTLLMSGCQTTTKNSDMEHAAQLNASLGLKYMQSGDNVTAMQKLEKALEQDEDNANAHHYLAELYRRLDVPEKARDNYLRAIDLAPKDSSIKNNYAAFLCQQGAVSSAFEVFEEVLNDPLYSDKGNVYENKALCAQLTGNIKLAEENYLLAVKYNPIMPRSLLALSQIEFDKQNRDKAYMYFNQFTQTSRHTPQSLWLGILLERGRGNKDRIASFENQLKGMFPDSKETELLKKLKKQGKL